MSKPVFDRYIVCVLCRGVECSLDSCCDECFEWSPEAYLKHKQVLLHKDCRRKDSLPQPPSSPMSSPSPSPVSSFNVASVDDRIDAKLVALSSSFDQKLDSLSPLLLSRISLLQAPSEPSM